MRTWNLTAADPGSYILAADARFGPSDYANDHIWEFHLSGGEPPAMGIQTTFGLRARGLRIFPRFLEGDLALSNPAEFAVPPQVEQVLPNYLRVLYQPLTGIEVLAEYLVPESQLLAGRVRVTNNRLAARELRFELAAVLAPLEAGARLANQEQHAVTILSGASGGLFPVVFMTGGPSFSAGPYPALSIDLNLAPGAARQLTWVVAGRDSLEASFEAARHFATQPWDARVAGLENRNAGLVEIESDNPAWDAAFMLAQKAAFNAFVGPTETLPAASFVLSRQPDQGYSLRGDGSEYSYLWNGQPALEASYLAGLILPAEPGLARGLLENFLATQNSSGFIDWKPGLAGQRSGLLATPILANLAWHIYQATEERGFLAEIFPKLVRYVQSWFAQEQDRDGDGIPEWSHVIQSGFEEQPTFSQWQPGAQGADIRYTESPALCSFLYNEIQVLLKMARLLESSEPVPALESLADMLKTAVETSWDPQARIYRNWDRTSHFSPAGQVLVEFQGPAERDIEIRFEQPARLVLQIESSDQRSRPVKVTLHGHNASGQHRVETLAADQFAWLLGRGNVTSQQVYRDLEYLTVSGLEAEDRVSLQVVDLARCDQTLLLPLWAGIPNTQRATELVQATILDPERFWRTFGVPACLSEGQHTEEACQAMHLPWNALLIAGLIRYGFTQEAVELFTSNMNAVVENLTNRKACYHHYDVETGTGLGERHALTGLPSLGLYLRLLGVQLISARRVIIQGLNPFPNQVTVRYRGLTIICERERTRITFQGGQTAVVNTTAPRLVTLENES